MDDQERDLKQAWRADERAKARDAFPLPLEALTALFAMLDTELTRSHCDHSRRLTEGWLAARRYDVERVCAWLDEHSGFCDCDVRINVRQHVEDSVHDQTGDAGN